MNKEKNTIQKLMEMQVEAFTKLSPEDKLEYIYKKLVQMEDKLFEIEKQIIMIFHCVLHKLSEETTQSKVHKR